MKFALRLLLAALIAASLLPSANAQLGNMMKTLGGTPAAGAEAVNKADFSKLLESTTGNVMAARIEFLNAQADLASALGLKNDALIKASEGLRAVEGSSSSPGDKIKALKDSSQATAGAKKELNDALTKSDKLSDESKKKFGQGAVKFVHAILLEKAQIEIIKKLVDQGKVLAGSSNPFDKVKAIGLVKPVTDMAIMVPGDVQEGFTTFGHITSLAQQQNIAVPSLTDQNAALGKGDQP